MKKLLGLIPVIICMVLCALAAVPCKARHFSERDGLLNRQAFSIETDTAGFVWVYTTRGLARYDGSEFRPYYFRNGAKPHNDFATLTGRMGDGYLWVSFNSGQLFGYNPVYDRFEEFADVSAIGEDMRLENALFRQNDILLSTSDGVYLKKDTVLRRFALPGSVVNSVIAAPGNTLYASTTAGLYHIRENADGTVREIVPVENTAGISMDKMACAAGKVFVGSFANSIYVVDEKEPYKARKIQCAVPKMPVTDIDVRDGSIFAAVDGAGVYEIDARTEDILHHYSYDSKSGSLSANTVSGVCFDSKGGMWVSNSSQGVDYIDETTEHPTLIRHDSHNGNSLIADCVNAIFRDADGDMWYGTDLGLSVCRKDGRWQHFLDGRNGPECNILSIAQAPDGTIYAGGYGSGLWTIDKRSGAVRRMPSRESDKGVGTDYIYEIYADGDNLWFGGIRGELTRYNMASDTYYYYPSECICDMSLGPDGKLFISGCGGVAVFGPDGKFEWVRKIGDIEIYNYTRDVVYDPQRNEMWFATDGQGLIRQNIADGTAEVFALGDDSELANIYGLALDRNNNLWFFTENNLYVIGADRGKAMCVTPLLELEAESFIMRSRLLDSEGRLHIGTVDGVITIDPEMILKDASPIKIVFNDIEINHSKASVGEGALPVAPEHLGRLVLAHNQNTFSVRFSTLNLGNTRRYVYRWRLKGYDNEWQKVPDSHEIICHNIPHGDYTMEIQAVDAVGGEVVAERMLPVTVRPPFWLTWWAKLSYVLLALVLVWLVAIYVRKRQREQRITDKIQSFLNLVHDLRAPVTLIKAPLGEIENRADLPEDTIRNARLAMSNVDKLLGMIGKLLDLRRESQHSDCLNLTRTNILDFLKSKVAEWRVAALQKGLRIEVSVPDDMPPVAIDCNKLSHILDNLLSNAIKYTFQGSVTVSARCDKKTWTLEIADTGIGIPVHDRGRLFRNEYRGQNAISTDEIGSGMGLLIVHRLCRLHKAKVSVSSRENQGTTFTLVFPREIKAPARQIPDRQETVDMPVPATDSTKETIVLVDDERDILDYLSQSLSDTYNVICYSGAEEVLADVGNINPDIVVSDVRLKGMSGYELCQKLKTSVETSHIPVILLSALSERESIILGLESGANDYIVKPFDISVLRLRIRNILASRRQMQTRIMSGEEQPGKEEAINELDREFMERIMAVIDGHISDSEYSIADLCRDMGMSRTTIYNKIKALSGESINEYIRVRRLSKAKELLESRRYTISEVAYMTGFSDPKYFSTCFKKQYGISPSKL